jgi:two-component system, cell cycle sensor histidine kinase and response regulator CckA
MEQKINVLYLNSYNNGYEWSDNIFEGIQEKFQNSGKNIYIQVEYMDSKRYHEENFLIFFLIIINSNFATRFDLIIVSDNNAFDFINQHANELFPMFPSFSAE